MDRMLRDRESMVPTICRKNQTVWTTEDSLSIFYFMNPVARLEDTALDSFFLQNLEMKNRSTYFQSKWHITNK
ncbi:MAG: hypothetical protein NTZ52_06840 [Chlamydiae bacterium]|nr:hypothetical protein [Chlamydiota bacterium]